MKLLLRRIISTAVLLAGISIINFSLYYFSLGDPSNRYFNPKVKKSQLELIKHQMGTDQSWHTQFVNWSSNFLQGDFGYSWAKHRPVKDILTEAVPATLQLTILALIVNLILGCILGVAIGIKSNKTIGKILDHTTLILYSLPSFLVALLLIYLFSLKLKLLPVSGMNSFFVSESDFWSKLWDRLQHLILPVTVLSLVGAAATSRYLAGQLKQVLKQDFIRLAFAKGLSKKRIYFYHALKNAAIPLVTLLGIYFPFLLGSTLIIEIIFAWPGMGRVAFEAFFSKDYPVIMAVNLFAGIMVIAGNLIADVLYRVIDPRIRVQ